VTKDDENMLTPLKVTANPPQGWSRPIQDIPVRQESPSLGPDS